MSNPSGRSWRRLRARLLKRTRSWRRCALMFRPLRTARQSFRHSLRNQSPQRTSSRRRPTRLLGVPTWPSVSSMVYTTRVSAGMPTLPPLTTSCGSLLVTSSSPLLSSHTSHPLILNSAPTSSLRNGSPMLWAATFPSRRASSQCTCSPTHQASRSGAHKVFRPIRSPLRTPPSSRSVLASRSLSILSCRPSIGSSGARNRTASFVSLSAKRTTSTRSSVPLKMACRW
mmetsp:Transcript_19075/g.57601  ORF Transcript_19075/g.57601 Transcript_19075/m.57601 type:complete len:228 (+) Transcript_19075:4254-4937(+)